MEVKLVERGAFSVCGYAVETTLEKNDRDISKLFHDFFRDEEEMLALCGCKSGFYGLSWYTEGHEKYCYLLGREVAGESIIPKGSLLKTIPNALYAVTLVQDADIKDAWTVFFYEDIPKAGLEPNEEHGYYFEYYPKSVYGICELWVPVRKAGECCQDKKD